MEFLTDMLVFFLHVDSWIFHVGYQASNLKNLGMKAEFNLCDSGQVSEGDKTNPSLLSIPSLLWLANLSLRQMQNNSSNIENIKRRTSRRVSGYISLFSLYFWTFMSSSMTSKKFVSQIHLVYLYHYGSMQMWISEITSQKLDSKNPS